MRVRHEPPVEEQVSEHFPCADGVVLETRLDIDDGGDDLVDARDAGEPLPAR